MTYAESDRPKPFTAPRVLTQGRLMVESRTIGTAMPYRFNTHNVSASGLLLSTESVNHIPFAENTLLELTIDPSCEFNPRPVRCLGKVIRRETLEEDSALPSMRRMTRIGVQIVQMDEASQVAWEICRERVSVETHEGVSFAELA
jgi:hypothetical protein